VAFFPPMKNEVPNLGPLATKIPRKLFAPANRLKSDLRHSRRQL
jgi:hypothetical protein